MAYEQQDDREWPALRAALVAVAMALLAATILHLILSDAPMEPADDDGRQPTYELVLDCGNEALMHSYGLPTKADVMQWHLHGQWGYYQDGILMAYDDLPGRDELWDELYAIEANPNFDK